MEGQRQNSIPPKHSLLGGGGGGGGGGYNYPQYPLLSGSPVPDKWERKKLLQNSFINFNFL